MRSCGPFSFAGELLQQLQGLFDGACDNGFVLRFDYRALDEVRVGDHGGDDVLVGSFVVEAGRGGPANELYGPEARFCDERGQALFGKRLFEVIDLVAVDAVFTKQPRKIAAGRSGRFFVDRYLHLCKRRG